MILSGGERDGVRDEVSRVERVVVGQEERRGIEVVSHAVCGLTIGVRRRRRRAGSVGN